MSPTSLSAQRGVRTPAGALPPPPRSCFARVELTKDPARRAGRALAAAETNLHAGAFEPAAALLGIAEAGPLDELGRAQIELLTGQIAFAQRRSSEALPLLLAAARRLEQLDVPLARETYLEAVSALMHAGHLASNPGSREVGKAARGAPPSPRLRPSDLLLDALAVRFADGYAASVPIGERAVEAFCDEAVPLQEELRWLGLATVCRGLWDDERWHMLRTRRVAITRAAGALTDLQLALDSRAFVHLFAGEVDAAASLVEEARAVSAAIGSRRPPSGALALVAVRGREREARALIDATISGFAPRGQGLGVTLSHWANAVLCNGLGHYEEALTAAQAAARHPRQELCSPHWSLAELVEAAARFGARELASDALDRLSPTTRASGTNWALGLEARSRALLSGGDVAERFYREAIERLDRTRIRLDLARARLLYGEWLRRENRRADAREQLRAAHEMFVLMGAEAFAERARRELLATGATVRRLHQRDARHADAPGDPDRPARGRREDEPGDRRTAVHQRAHRRVPPAEGLHQAQRQLPEGSSLGAHAARADLRFGRNGRPRPSIEMRVPTLPFP